jgi:UDP-N-acetylmuramoylalanine--D-glutamate ligase
MGKPIVVRDVDGLTSWHADWKKLRVAVLGLGVTGFSVADTLAELGADVLVVAQSATSERADLVDVIGARLAIQADRGNVPPELTSFDAELVIVSPGFSPDDMLIAWAHDRGIPIWGDIELAWRVRDKVSVAEWVLVTGTNGKTTTVQLTTHLLVAAGHRAVAVGNIGIPVLDAVRDPIGFDTLVVELSSFQLHWIKTTGRGALHPLSSVCLNVADDHLDWHGSRASYESAKGAVYANTKVACVYNKADDVTQRMVEEADVTEGCRAIGFGLGAPGPSDIGIVGDIVVDRAFHHDRHHSALELTTREYLAVAGLDTPHMVANVLAACALARACDVSPEVVRDALLSFQVDHHRTESVAVSAGVRWVNDSKATNPHAASASLAAFDSVVWIVGGLLKGVDIGELVEQHRARVKAAIIIGADRDVVLAAFARHAPDVAVFEVVATETRGVMPEAVRLAAEVASEGDVVLLAPAAASMDQFVDYADRGTLFAAAVMELVGGAGHDDATHSGSPEAPDRS